MHLFCFFYTKFHSCWRMDFDYKMVFTLPQYFFFLSSSCNTDAKLSILKYLHQSTNVMLWACLSSTLCCNKQLWAASIAICSIFQEGSLGLGLLWGHVVPVCVYFFSHLRDIWTLAPCFAETCWLFLAQGHGGKSHKKRNYIIAYLEATRFRGSHPSNVWGVFWSP